MDNRATVKGVNKVFLFFTGLYLLFQFILGILTGIFGNKVLEGKYLYIILLINQFIIVLLPVLYYTLRNKLNIKSTFRFNRLKLIPAVIILAISVPAYFVASMLNNFIVFFLQHYIKLPEVPIPIPGNKIELLISLFVLAISPAICEELMHRGLFLNAYERRGTIRAVFLTAIVFGLFHFEITNLVGPIFLGILIAFYVVRTNSIYAGMLAHFVNNAFFVFIQYSYKNNFENVINVSITTEALTSISIIGTASLFIVFLLINVFKKVTQKTDVELPAIGNIQSDISSIFFHWPMILVLLVYIVILITYLIDLL